MSTSTFQRRHYEQILAILGDLDEATPIAALKALEDLFAADNPLFNRLKFRSTYHQLRDIHDTVFSR